MPEAVRLAEEPDTSAVQSEEDALYDKLRGWFRDDREHLGDWYDQAEEDYRFTANDPWKDEEKATLNQRNQAPVVFNIVGPMIDAVSGYEVANRQETRYIPRQLGASGVSEVVTSAASYFRDNTNADSHESAAFRDATICGIGATETYIDFDDNPDGEYRKRRVSPLCMAWDRKARGFNFEDARRVHRVHTMTVREALDMFPDADKEDLSASWADERVGRIHEVRPDAYAGADDKRDAFADTDTVQIVETQWWEFEPFMRFQDPMTGQDTQLSMGEWQILTDRLLEFGMPTPRSVQQRRKVYRRAFLGKRLLAEVQPTPVEGHFTYKFITAKIDEVKGTPYGIVVALKDPQRYTNKLFSQVIHIISTNAKGGLLAEEGAFENPRKAMAEWAKADSITITNNGALAAGRIQPKPQTQINPALFQLMDFAMNMGPRVTGINLEFLGMREANQAGVLEYQRRQAGVTILATLFDSLRFYRIDEGRLTLRMIQKYLSDGRLFRIVGQEDAPFLPLNRDATLGEYEVIVDDAPTSPNQKEKTWAITQQMLPVLGPVLQNNPALAAEFFKSSPLPESLIQKLAKAMPDKPPGADEQQEAAKAAAFAKINRDDAAAEKDRATALKTYTEALVPLPMVPPVLEGPFPVAPQPPAHPPPGMMGGMPGLPGLPPLGTVTPPPMPDAGMPGPGGPNAMPPA